MSPPARTERPEGPRGQVPTRFPHLRVGGWKPAREQGSARAEGKEYVVQGGDGFLATEYQVRHQCHPTSPFVLVYSKGASRRPLPDVRV